MRLRSWAWNTSRSVRNYSKKIAPRNVEAERSDAPGVLAEKDRHPEDRQELDNVFLNLARMRIQPQVDSAAKRVHTSAGDLPLSPLMNPAYLAAKRKYQNVEPKAKVDYSKHGKMEKQLARNPYAWALAGPVRDECITRYMLPRFFLQDFAFIKHPQTKRPWMVPVSLMSESDKDAEAHGDFEEAARFKAASDGSHALKLDSSTEGSSRLNTECDTDQPDDAFTSSPSRDHREGGGHNLAAARKGKPRGLPRPASPTAHALCRYDVLRMISPSGDRPSARGNQSWQSKRFRGRMASMAKIEDPNNVVFRADMDTYVLSLMRARTMEQLMHYARICDAPVRPKKYLLRCEGHWDQVQTHTTHRGCVLWMGDCGKKKVKRPGEFETVRLQGVKIGGGLPVHDLTVLLGPENVKKLRIGSRIFSEGSTFLLGGLPSTRLQMKLWKLQGYLASHGKNALIRSMPVYRALFSK